MAHNKHDGHDPNAFRRQFWIVLARAPNWGTASRGMMTLISLAIVVAFAASWAPTSGGVFEVEVWWELATLSL